MANLLILLFDGSCGVCHWAVRFVLRHDRARRFRFAPLTSSAGRRLLDEYHVDPAVDSLVLFDNGKTYLRSDAVTRLARHLGGAWPVLGLATMVPRRWRDAWYDRFARRRQAISRRFGL